MLRRVLAIEGTSLSRADFDAWCDAAGLMSKVTLKAINDASYQHTSEALLEGEDLLEINEFTRTELKPPMLG